MKRMFWMMPVALMAILGAVSLPAAPAMARMGGEETRMRIDLAGATIAGVTAKGRAEYRAAVDFRSLKVQAEQVNLPNGTVLQVTVNGVNVGKITITLMRGELQISTKDGQAVPTIGAGAVVAAFTSSGKVIVQGRF